MKKLKQAVKNGNIEPQGGMWVEPDTNLPCGESLIRQCFYGKTYFRKEFGKDVKTLWLPDVFGYTAALPQIIKKCGMDNFLTIKLSWNTVNQFPYHTIFMAGAGRQRGACAYAARWGITIPTQRHMPLTKSAKKYKEKAVSKIAFMPFGIGDGGGGPGEYHVEMAKRCEKLPYLPKVKLSSSESIF